MVRTKNVKRRLYLEAIFAIVIAIAPIVFYSYKYLPVNKDKIDFFLFSVSSNGFENASTAIYFYLTKLIPLTLLVVWFITNKNWWYHVILVPISMYAFQLFSAINTSGDLDENEILYVVAVSMVIVPIVYFIRLKLVDKYVHGIDLKAMNTELQVLKEKEELRKEREKLEKLKEELGQESDTSKNQKSKDPKDFMKVL